MSVLGVIGSHACLPNKRTGVEARKTHYGTVSEWLWSLTANEVAAQVACRFEPCPFRYSLESWPNWTKALGLSPSFGSDVVCRFEPYRLR